MRLREVSRDLMTLIFGVGVMLIWAGFIEAFLSQYHEPVIPYELKIAFGLVELILLTVYLAWSGRERQTSGRLIEGEAEINKPGRGPALR